MILKHRALSLGGGGGEATELKGEWHLSVCAISKKVRDYDPYFYTSRTDEQREIENKIPEKAT